MENKTPFMAKKRNVVLIAILYTFLWGSAFPLIKICMEAFRIAADDNLAKCLLAGIRFFFAGLLTLFWCGIKTKESLSISVRQWKVILFYGIIGTAVQYAVTYIGLSRIDGSKGAVFDQICVFMIVLASGIFFRNDRLTWKKLLGCALGFMGVFAITADEFSFSFSLGGEGMMLLAATCQTAAYFIAKQSAGDLPAIKLVGYGQTVGGALLFLFAILMGGRLGAVSFVGILTLLALIAIAAVAYVLSLMPLKYFAASEISSFNLLITLFGVIMSGLILGENILRLNYLISLILISLGILSINWESKEN